MPGGNKKGDAMSEARFQPAGEIFVRWRDELRAGTAPILYRAGDGDLAHFEIGPGLVTLLGGPPGQGKTALAMQLVFEALDRKPDLRAVVLSVEMSPATLLDRQLARLASVDLTLIRHRRLGTEHADAIEQGLDALDRLCDRLAFVKPPFDIANLGASVDAFGGDLALIDYIQRLSSPSEIGDRRGAIEATMSHLRRFADEGYAMLVVAALARSRDARGRSSYSEGLSLASFRETSELEYGADDAYILAHAAENEPADRVTLKHLKSRHGEPQDISLRFDRPHQRFTPLASEETRAGGNSSKLQGSLRAAWNRAENANGKGPQ